jgi:hypothetical protein
VFNSVILKNIFIKSGYLNYNVHIYLKNHQIKLLLKSQDKFNSFMKNKFYWYGGIAERFEKITYSNSLWSIYIYQFHIDTSDMRLQISDSPVCLRVSACVRT